MTGTLKIVAIVLLGVWAARWLGEEEYGEMRFQRIINDYVSGKAAQGR